eukprot:2266402-Pyramimonas_sp.AAC.1
MPPADDRDLHLPGGVAFQEHQGRKRSTTTRGLNEASQAAPEPGNFRWGRAQNTRIRAWRQAEGPRPKDGGGA